MPGIEGKGDYWHLRIRPPSYFDPNSFRVITLPRENHANPVKAVIGCEAGKYEGGRCRDGTQTQKLMFPKSRFKSKGDVKAWVRKRIKRRKKPKS